MSETKSFTVSENKGSISYIIMYWSATGCPVTVHKPTYKDALNALSNLKKIGIKASVFLNLTNGCAKCLDDVLARQLEEILLQEIDPVDPSEFGKAAQDYKLKGGV